MRDNRTASQIAQDEEASNRSRSIVDDAGNDIGADPHQNLIDDSTGENDLPARQPRQQDEPETEARHEPIRMSPNDLKRLEIAKRFKRNADGDEDAPFNGDPNDPEMRFGKVARQTIEPEPGESIVGQRVEEPAPQDEPQPKLTKLIVRGKDVWLTDAQILERAAKVEAADSYLEEGRSLLEQARRVNREQRTSPDLHHPEDQTGTQNDDLNVDDQSADQHPDELAQAIEEIQFGDPKNAADKIRQVIDRAADQSADKRQKTRLINNDVAKSQADLKAFMGQNPDLAKDEVANVVLEKTMYDIYREDITKLGVDPAVIPTDTTELANWHRFYRVEGKPVRTTAEALQEAKGRFDKWRGVTKQSPQPQRQQPRVEVNVDRTARREAIQNQPTRAVAPRPDAVRQAPTRKSRHDIIMDMRRSRGRPVA